MIEVSPITKEDLPALIEAAGADGHLVVFPSHVVRKDGRIVGYTSECVMPVYHLWLHSSLVTARDTLKIQKQVEGRLKTKGFKMFFTLCQEGSPLFSKMFKRGFTPLQTFTVFLKSLKS